MAANTAQLRVSLVALAALESKKLLLAKKRAEDEQVLLIQPEYELVSSC